MSGVNGAFRCFWSLISFYHKKGIKRATGRLLAVTNASFRSFIFGL